MSSDAVRIGGNRARPSSRSMVRRPPGQVSRTRVGSRTVASSDRRRSSPVTRRGVNQVSAREGRRSSGSACQACPGRRRSRPPPRRAGRSTAAVEADTSTAGRAAPAVERPSGARARGDPGRRRWRHRPGERRRAPGRPAPPTCAPGRHGTGPPRRPGRSRDGRRGRAQHDRVGCRPTPAAARAAPAPARPPVVGPDLGQGEADGRRPTLLDAHRAGRPGGGRYGHGAGDPRAQLPRGAGPPSSRTRTRWLPAADSPPRRSTVVTWVGASRSSCHQAGSSSGRETQAVSCAAVDRGVGQLPRVGCRRPRRVGLRAGRRDRPGTVEHRAGRPALGARRQVVAGRCSSCGARHRA